MNYAGVVFFVTGHRMSKSKRLKFPYFEQQHQIYDVWVTFLSADFSRR